MNCPACKAPLLYLGAYRKKTHTFSCLRCQMFWTAPVKAKKAKVKT